MERGIGPAVQLLWFKGTNVGRRRLVEADGASGIRVAGWARCCDMTISWKFLSFMPLFAFIELQHTLVLLLGHFTVVSFRS